MTEPGCTRAGWYWYCDIHDTHGNADHKAEAVACADAHVEYWERIEARSAEGCDISVHQAGLDRLGPHR